jgi:hypothetical protein
MLPLLADGNDATPLITAATVTAAVVLTVYRGGSAVNCVSTATADAAPPALAFAEPPRRTRGLPPNE